MPAFKIVAGVLTPLQVFFNMVIFFCPECLKYQKDNPGTRLFVAYVCVVIRTPAWVEAIRKMFLPSQTATPNTEDDEDVDDGIGFSTYHEESPDTQEARRLNEVVNAESDAPPR